MKSQIITFENPPVNEVVISTYFNPPLSDFRNEHIGLFWERIRGEFPIVRQQFPVGIGLEFAADEPSPMPRYWFIAGNDINLIQIQKNAFIFNWRRRNKDYPRFHRQIKPTFDKYYGLFSEFIRTEIKTVEEFTVDLCELTYINALERCEVWSGPQDTAKVIPSFSILETDINAYGLPEFNCNYAYKIATDLQLNIGIRTATKAQQPEVPVLIFEIKASGRLGKVGKPATDEWFERAHDDIKRCFVSVTSPDIQINYWKLVEKTQ